MLRAALSKMKLQRPAQNQPNPITLKGRFEWNNQTNRHEVLVVHRLDGP